MDMYTGIRGGTAGNLIDRQTELFAQKAAYKIGIDKSVIYMDISGWKISLIMLEMLSIAILKKSDKQLEMAMEYLHKLHQLKTDSSIKIFDNIIEGKS